MNEEYIYRDENVPIAFLLEIKATSCHNDHQFTSKYAEILSHDCSTTDLFGNGCQYCEEEELRELEEEIERHKKEEIDKEVEDDVYREEMEEGFEIKKNVVQKRQREEYYVESFSQVRKLERRAPNSKPMLPPNCALEDCDPPLSQSK